MTINEVAQRLSISVITVKRTLEDMGWDSSRKEFNEEEFSQIQHAEQLKKEAGGSRQAVRDFFGTTTQNELPEDDESDPALDDLATNPYVEQVYAQERAFRERAIEVALDKLASDGSLIEDINKHRAKYAKKAVKQLQDHVKSLMPPPVSFSDTAPASFGQIASARRIEQAGEEDPQSSSESEDTSNPEPTDTNEE